MKFLLLAIALFLFIGIASGCDSTDVEPEVVAEPEIERSYSKSIVREADNEFESLLIRQAEATYPPRDSVLAAVPPQQHGGIPEEGYWYYSSFDGVYILYTITGDAVDYYSGLIDEIEAGARLQFLMQAELKYHAAVKFEEAYTIDLEDPRTKEPLPTHSYQRVYVVSMSLKWFQYCGPLCAMWIDHERIVIFNEGGELLAVFLDGPHPVAVS